MEAKNAQPEGIAPEEASAPEVTSEPPAAASAAEGKAAGAEPKQGDAPPNVAPHIPPILLEGDEPAVPLATGPGHKFELGQPPPPAPTAPAPTELPEAYGTGHLLAVARDPHHLYAHWDLTAEQQGRYNQLAAERHLVLRVRSESGESTAPADIHLQPQSRYWFVPVEHAGERYSVELGYYQDVQGALKGGHRAWVSIATSGPVSTAAGTVSDDKSVTWATLPGENSFPEPEPEMPAPAQPLVRPGCPPLPLEWMPGFSPVPAELGLANLPGQVRAELLGLTTAAQTANWTPSKERTLAELIGLSLAERRWPQAVEILDLLRRGQFPSSLSSPVGGQWPLQKGFWFNVNAELIIYGATEPDAMVSIGAQPIMLRPDGTFSIRVALPDGQHQLGATAVSARGDFRQAELSFTRQTRYEAYPDVSPARQGERK